MKRPAAKAGRFGLPHSLEITDAIRRLGIECNWAGSILDCTLVDSL